MRKIYLISVFLFIISNASAQNYWGNVALPDPGSCGLGVQLLRSDDNGNIYLGDNYEDRIYKSLRVACY